jgi:hypothetical protein
MMPGWQFEGQLASARVPSAAPPQDTSSMKPIGVLPFVVGLTMAAVPGPASAENPPPPPCMPGGVCCAAVGFGPTGPDNRCGTLEQFQRYAKIVCLQADAIENKSLPESITASGRCAAAKIAANKFEAAQRANAADHQRAMDARRQLREMGVNPD